MGAAFVITLREAFEAALVLGIVYTYLYKVGAGEGTRLVTLGAIAGAIASVLMGVAMTVLSGPLADIGPDVVAVIVMFGAAALLTWHGWWMSRHARAIRGTVERRIDEARSKGRLWILALIAFTGVFREGAETVLFLWGLVSQGGASGWTNLAGAVLGVTVAAMLGWLAFATGQYISIRRFFMATSILLLLVAAGLFSSGVGRLEGLGALPRSMEVWDTSGVLDDRSVVGSLLTGLVGYRARPSLFELASYALFIGFGAYAFFGGRRSARPPLTQAAPSSPAETLRAPMTDAGDIVPAHQEPAPHEQDVAHR
jgi:high-affinity iron transporter